MAFTLWHRTVCGSPGPPPDHSLRGHRRGALPGHTCTYWPLCPRVLRFQAPRLPHAAPSGQSRSRDPRPPWSRGAVGHREHAACTRVLRATAPCCSKDVKGALCTGLGVAGRCHCRVPPDDPGAQPWSRGSGGWWARCGGRVACLSGRFQPPVTLPRPACVTGVITGFLRVGGDRRGGPPPACASPQNVGFSPEFKSANTHTRGDSHGGSGLP